MYPDYTAIYPEEWFTFVLLIILGSATIAMVCSTITMYIDLWRFDEKGEFLPPPSLFRFLRSSWFIYLNAWLALTSTLALVVLT